MRHVRLDRRVRGWIRTDAPPRQQVSRWQRRGRQALLADAARPLRATGRRISFRLRPVPVPEACGLRRPDVRVGAAQLREPAIRIHCAPGQEERADCMDAQGHRRTAQRQAVGCGVPGGQVGADDARGHRGAEHPQPRRREVVRDGGRISGERDGAAHCVLRADP